MISLWIIVAYLGVLLAFALTSRRFFRGTSVDYFVASRSIGPFMLLMSVFGTTMTAFALVGSTGKAFQRGVGTYGLMASSSGLIHALCFFLIGIKLWSLGKRYGYVTQIQFFRARFESDRFGYLLFPILVALVVPYLLIGVIGSYRLVGPATKNLFPGLGMADGSLPPWLIGLVVCGVVLTYIFAGGSRAAAWANTFQTLVFMAMGVLAFHLISSRLGGLEAAIGQANPAHLVRTPSELHYGEGGSSVREAGVPPLMFLTYMFIPLSVGMFPHLFQHWLTARSARAFKLTVVAHPVCIMIVWVPCVLIGLWATGVFVPGNELFARPPLAVLGDLPDAKVGAVLVLMLKGLVENPVVVGMVMAGVLAAIMSSLDSQFLCLGTMFTNDIVLHKTKRKFSDGQVLLLARGFVVGIVVVTYLLSLLLQRSQNVFDLAVWSFSGFAALTPLVFAALYWRRATKAGAYASVLATAGTWLVFFVLSGFGGEHTVLGGVMPVAVCWLAGAAAMLTVSLATPPPSDETVAKFFR